MADTPATAPEQSGGLQKVLDWIERTGNKLPDPAMIFFFSLVIVWLLSWLLSGMSFEEIDPRTGEAIVVNNQLTGDALATFLAGMVKTFTGFAPLGVVLVAMLGVGVAEHSGFINTGIKRVLDRTPQFLLTPIVILVAIVSHTATDAGYVLVIPLAGVIYYAMGRHPLAGITAAFAGVSGGFSANFVPSAIDPLLQSFTQSAAQIVDPAIQVNPLNNYFFTSASSVLVILVGWYLNDKIIEPRLAKVKVDGDPEDIPKFADVTAKEKRALFWALVAMGLGVVALVAAVWPESSALRAPNGEIASFSAPLMHSIVPLIFLLFIIPGIVYGYLAGTFENSRDVIGAMSKAMDGMSYYIVMAFFCALFISAFNTSNIGALLAVKGADTLREWALPASVTVVGMILLTAFVNLFVGSASAKWALIGPILVPMLMQLGLSPDLTQAAYRIGDSSSNIITPLMPYFPLVVVYAQRYVKGTGIGTLISIMLPYSLVLLVLWTAFLLIYWSFGLPLGIQASYVYPAP
ncbi:AbgT family transporter [Simiduia agarivorans]|uniref:Transporter AbgT n=1 Tax=Simiduia agarivorans (strain DSM 21679 / JCM 13881 / BCRC 17597 / SA1) TaxID=1117647 RepID=K4KMP4_SIMAS|nr:AbgT family transporter [Simiduia agarivorans]AFU99363.1 transporter AbgT [Simiduia agarivorans SA1 = DSM 21679]